MIHFLILAVIILLGYLYLSYFHTSRRHLPEGVKEAPIEYGWPILGILPNITRPLCHYLIKLGEKHGDLYRIKIGMREIYVLNSYDILKKCLREDGDNFSGRWKGKLMELTVENSGVLFVDGTVWSEHKSFMLRVLRDFGFGKSRTTEIVQEECHHLLKEIEHSGVTNIDFSTIIPIYSANIISKFLMNKRFERDEEDFKFIEATVDKLMRQEDKVLFFHIMFPAWDESLFLSRISFRLTKREQLFERLHEIFRKELKNHSENLDLNSEGDNLMDRSLIERSRIIEKTGSEQTFTEFQLILNFVELFIAGYETNSTTLVWSLFLLSKYSEIQQKMHDEIVNVIGSDQMPSTNDRKSLPLTQAIMDEIMRISSVTPVTIPHRSLKDTIIDGIFIAGNSLILPNLYACHRDGRIWEKPFEFYPEHFLTNDSEGNLKYNAREELVAFGLGKRQCLGESLARVEYFIFLVSIIQRFRVSFAETVSEEEYRSALLANEGLIRFSKIKNFIFEKYE